MNGIAVNDSIGVAQDVEAGRRGHLRRHRARVVRIEEAERRLEPAAGDAGLGVQLLEVEDLTPVVSLPVPAVVGIAISGFSGPGTGRPLPIGGLT